MEQINIIGLDRLESFINLDPLLKIPIVMNVIAIILLIIYKYLEQNCQKTLNISKQSQLNIKSEQINNNKSQIKIKKVDVQQNQKKEVNKDYKIIIQTLKNEISNLKADYLNFRKETLCQLKKYEMEYAENLIKIQSQINKYEVIKSQQITNQENQNKQNQINELQQQQSIIDQNLDQQNNEDKNNIIFFLYDKTCKLRYVEPQYRNFVGEELGHQDLIKEYGMSNLKCKQFLQSNLKGMRKVRGDGNCFYTAFVFQYLIYNIIESSEKQFALFLQTIEQLTFQIQFNKEQFMQTQFDQLKKIFITKTIQLRQLELQSRYNKLLAYFQDDENDYYGLSIVFMRNLAYSICSKSELCIEAFKIQNINLENELLEWEHDCVLNEPIISSIAENQNILVNLFFCDNQNMKIDKNQYQNQDQNSQFVVNLLFRPGHYSIGLSLDKKNEY